MSKVENMTDQHSSDISPNTSDIFRLKYNNPDGDTSIGFKYSKYKDSMIEKVKEQDKIKFVKPTSYELICCKQTKLMTKKNFLVLFRNSKPTMFLMLTPIGVCLILLFLQLICNDFTQSYINKNPEPFYLSNLNKCEYPNDCTTIGYGIISSNNSTSEYVENIMKYVAQENSLEYNKDVKLITIGDSNAYLEYLKKNLNKTKFGVVFCLDSLEYFNVTIPCTFEYYNYTFHMYTVLYNVTNSPNGFLSAAALPLPSYPELTKLKVDLDNAHLKYYADKRGLGFTPKINLTIQSNPITQSRFFEKSDVTSSIGAFYFFFPPMITFVVILLEIIREKDFKLRKSLLIIGLNNNAFWLSWFITSVVFSTAISFILVLFAIICRFDVFTKTPFFLSFLLFFMFTMTMQFFAYFLTTILKSLKSAYTVSYAFILIGLVMEVFLSNYSIIYYLYSTDLPSWVGIIKFMFELYPPFNFSKAYSDIANKSAKHFDNYEWRWVDGEGYKWSDFTKRIRGTMRPNINYDVPSTAETMGLFLIDILLFFILAWYFDHVDSSNRGKTFSYFFFLDKNYWLNSRKQNKIPMNERETGQPEYIDKPNFLSQSEKKLLEKSSYVSSSEDSEDVNDIGLKTVIEEKLKIIRSEEENEYFDGLRILGCTKTYKIANKCCGTKDVNALKETYLDIAIGELFTILGHNGAGKSTLINILTGNSSPSSGTAKIKNSDIILDPVSIEEYIGLCPQHDILWEELTAKEHIELYAQLRNYDNKSINKLIDSKLREVNLVAQGNAEVRTYSGGMKRRLSILLSTIGNPQVIFLDEPTTGLDPVNKRFIWKMIHKMKKERGVILTTHSMEEADFLSDRVGVIVEGNFKCIGTPLELKQIYGSGYLLTFICDRDKLENVQFRIKGLMPSSTIISNSGGCIILNLPFEKANEMKYFISILNNTYNKPELKPLEGLIKECGMDYTTLEEIFLKVNYLNLT